MKNQRNQKFIFPENFNPGCLPDTPDYRDIPLGAVQEAVEIPESYFTPIDDLGVNSQGVQPSCVSQSADKIKEYQEREDWKKVFNFSPRFVYALSKKIDGWAGDGTYLRIGMKVLADYGICFESEFADNSQLSKDEYRDWSKIPAEAYTTAGAYKITSYARVDTNFEMLKQAIFQNGMVMMGFTGTNKGWQNARIVQPQLGEPTSDYWGHCFTAGNKVLTEEGYKNIEDIEIGDYVLTHNNRFKKVVAKKNRPYEGLVYKVKTFNNIDKIISTPEHPFYCAKVGGNKIIEAIRMGFLEKRKEFKKIEEINKNDDVLVSAILPTKDTNKINLERAFLLGAYLGDGNLKEKGRKKKDYYCVRFSLGTNDRKRFLKEKIIVYMKEEFDVEPKIYKVKNQKCEQVLFYKKEITGFFAKYCGTPNNKKIHSAILLLPTTKLLSFVEGWYLTDGCKIRNTKVISMANKDLAYSLTGILNKLKISYNLGFRKAHKGIIRGKEFNCKDSWHFHFRKNNYNSQSWFDGNHKILRPQSIEKVFFKGTVYDLEVEEDHSFTVGNLIVHNSVVAYGYDKDYIYFVNSWGISWGNQGKGFFGRDYTNIQDAWVSVDIQDNLINQYKLMKIIGENATKKQYVLMPNGKDLRHIAGVGTLEAGHNDKLWDMRAVSWIDDFSMYNILPEDFIIAKV